MHPHPDVVPTDDNRYALGLADDAPAFESRQFAAAVLAKEFAAKAKEACHAAQTS